MRKNAGRLMIIIGFLVSTAAGILIGYSMQVSVPENTGIDDRNNMVDSVEIYRSDRMDLRQKQIAQLNEIIQSDKTEPEIVSLAQQQLMTIMEDVNTEMLIENELRIRDFEDALASVRSDSVTVFLREQSISSQQAAIILENITSKTEISGANVKIVPIN